MTLRVVGAGLGRTGTLSLKLALERLLDAPCYHMAEVFQHPEHVPIWTAAARGELVDWDALLTGYAAAVDWPACAFWPALAVANPGAVVVLSTREPASWWRSASGTIFPATLRVARGDPWREMVEALFESTFTTRIEDEAACVAAFERHNRRVRTEASPARLVEWTASDGWEPLCRALGLPVPRDAFPHVNTREDFLRGR